MPTIVGVFNASELPFSADLTGPGNRSARPPADRACDIESGRELRFCIRRILNECDPAAGTGGHPEYLLGIAVWYHHTEYRS